jgi:hypothetical protein
MAETIGRLQAMYGKDAVLHATLRDAHRPEEMHRLSERSLRAPSPDRAAVPFRITEGASELVPAMRLVDPPQPLVVRLEGRRLMAFSWSHGSHRVRTMVGPRRLSGEWWDMPFARDYYEILTADSGLFWIFFSRPEGRWFLQGVFD